MKNKIKNIIVFTMMTAVVSGGILAVCSGKAYADSSISKANIGQIMDDAETNACSNVSLNELPDEKIYCVGSVSKVYVTAAVMQLADRGLVELDEPVSAYIPQFTMQDERYADITVRMLMDHTSGIMGTSENNMFLYDDKYKDADFLLENLSSQRLVHDPGEYAAYCNDGFNLLELIVENVTGTDFTEYVKKNIAVPVGATNTGSALTLCGNELKAPITFAGNIPYDYDYCMTIGAGGIYATASDVANFGSAFFKGKGVLLSEKSKEAMATRWNDAGEDTDDFKDGNGLGWDYVEKLAYEAEGVTVLGKGGDIPNQHAFLLVAPDEEVSVAVLSAGGSSNYNELMAEALLDVVLKERGIIVSHENDETYDFADEVPAKYREHEGFYVLNTFSGPTYVYISFDDSMMHVKHYNFAAEETEDYRFTTDGSFVRVDENGVPTVDCQIGRFEANENGVYITVEMNKQDPGLGSEIYYQYTAERINPNPVSNEAIPSWLEICGRDMVICNERYSSTEYDSPFANVYMFDEIPGYLYAVTGKGGRPLQIIDATNAIAFTTMPSSSNRDLIDTKLTSNKLSDATSITELSLTSGLNYRFVDELPTFTGDITEINLRSDEPQWYVIGGDVAGTTVTADCPENAVIYVYNKYHEVVYSTHMLNANGPIPLPSEGYIMFAGLTGESILIN